MSVGFLVKFEEMLFLFYEKSVCVKKNANPNYVK